MTRALLPGRWNRYGRAIPLNACTGNCNQGRSCTCDTELSNVIPLRPEFPAPVRRRRLSPVQRALAAAAGSMAAFAFLLWAGWHQ